MSLQRHITFWILATFVFALFLLVFREILLPFVAGLALAYFLDPVADKLQRWGANRLVATSAILIVFVLIFVLCILLVVPVLLEQVAAFAERLPSYIRRLIDFLDGASPDWLKSIVAERRQGMEGSVSELAAKGAGWLGSLLKSLWSGGLALVSIVSLVVVTPVVAFYMLYDWDRMIQHVDDWLPRDHADTIRGIATDINIAMAGFIRGQGTVCLALGLFYGISLSLAGLNFGLLIGLASGFMSFIPFVGAILGLVVSAGVAVVQFWPDWVMVSIIVVIFAVGQFIEGNFLSPKLVGESVGLHPVWLMFALFAFGYLFGFVGMLVAVPVAAAIGVLARFALARYLESSFYLGTDDPPGSDGSEQ